MPFLRLANSIVRLRAEQFYRLNERHPVSPHRLANPRRVAAPHTHITRPCPGELLLRSGVPLLSGAFRYVGGQPVRVAGQPQPQPMLALGGLLCIVGGPLAHMQAGRFWDVWSVFPHDFDLGHISGALVCTYTAPDTQCRGA